VIITLIEPSRGKRGRLLVHIDGAAPVELSTATITRRGLRPGADVPGEAIKAIIDADRRHQALEAAASLIARRMRSERELRRRLAMRKFDQPLIDATIVRLRELHLIDDHAFARSWVESRERSAPRGKRLIIQELRGMGVAAGDARSAVEDVSDADAAYRLAARRARTMDTLEYRGFRDRLGTYLVRRGFDWEVARATVERCWAERGGLPHDREEPIE
jgi:regulatory protein